MEEIQRSRILGAMAEEVAMRGASSVTVARVIARAGVSRRLFYELFADVEDCFLATFDWTVERARAQAVEAYVAHSSWRDAIRSGLAALLYFFDDQPLLAQLCVVHAAGGGPRVLEHRSRVISRLCEVVDRGRLETSGNRVPGPVVAEGVVGAVLAVLYTRLLARGTDVAGGRGEPGRAELGRAELRRAAPGRAAPGRAALGRDEPDRDEPPLIELHGELMSLILLPYLGAGVAGRELRKPPPPPRSPVAAAEPLPAARPMLDEPGARLTYRTVRVLRAIAELPAGSNREVAEAAGIVDQGQISKILSRLECQGLVVNRGGANPARGTPNSWWLTERGEALERGLREQPSERLPDEGEPQRKPRKGLGSRRPAG